MFQTLAKVQAQVESTSNPPGRATTLIGEFVIRGSTWRGGNLRLADLKLMATAHYWTEVRTRR
jgi:hypothetical protein